MEVLPWMEALCAEEFYGKCTKRHDKIKRTGGHAVKAPVFNIFCIDCEEKVCACCQPEHEGHTLLQVRTTRLFLLGPRAHSFPFACMVLRHSFYTYQLDSSLAPLPDELTNYFSPSRFDAHRCRTLFFWRTSATTWTFRTFRRVHNHFRGLRMLRGLIPLHGVVTAFLHTYLFFKHPSDSSLLARLQYSLAPQKAPCYFFFSISHSSHR